MTSQDLIGYLQAGRDVLKQNKAAVPPEKLNAAIALVTRLQTDTATMGNICTILGIDMVTLNTNLNAIQQALDLESKLVIEGLTEHIDSMLAGLEGRPVILAILGKLLS